MVTGLTIAPLTERDIPVLIALIRELAEYEKLLHEVEITPEDVREQLLGEKPRAEALIARLQGQAVGYAVFFHNYSTFTGRQGLFLEDIFVKPERRGQGIGRALFLHCVGVAHRRGCMRMDWNVLDWNQNSIEFYRSLGAEPLPQWTVYRLSESDIARLASPAADPGN